ncbi:MAG: hypothetical protein ACTSVU_10285 [Promethearchaeota archaeon]
MSKQKLSFLIINILVLSVIAATGLISVSAIPVAEDSYEDNDTMSNAANISSGWTYNLCQGDDDWFKMNVLVNYFIDVYLEMNGTLDNMDLELYDQNGTFINGSYGFGNSEELISLNSAPATDFMYIRIYGENINESYNLYIEVYANLDDIYEPNNFYFQSQWLNVPNYFSSLINLNDDFYRFNLNQESFVQIELWLSSNSSFRIETIDLNDGTVLATFYADFGYLYFDFNAAYSGEYGIAVKGLNTGESYDLQISVTHQNDDEYEPNNYFDQSTWIGDYLVHNYYEHLVNWDDDYYQFNLDQGNWLQVQIWCPSYSGFSLETIDPNNGMAITGDYSDEDGYLEVYVTGSYSGVYEIALKGPNTGDQYTLQFNIFYNSPNDDWAEENDYFTQFYWLDIPIHNYWGPMFNFDEDFYGFNANQNDFIQIQIFCASNTGLRLEIVDPGYGSVYLSDVSDDDGYLHLDYSMDFSGVFELAVKGPNIGTQYDLQIDVQSNLPDDEYENNDFIDQAIYLNVPGNWNDLISLDYDYYKFNLGADQSAWINVYVHDSSALVQLDLIDSETGNSTASDTSIISGKLSIEVHSTGFQEFVFLICGSLDGWHYNLEVSYNSEGNQKSDSGTTLNEEKTNPFENFDLSSIPGYTIEITTVFSIVTLIAIIFFVNRKNKQ